MKVFVVNRLVRIASVLLLIAGSSTVYSQTIIAHRGASHDAPENTLAAFRLAWEKGADGIEADFYLTKDGQIACIHDKTTKRLAPGQPVMTVAKSTLAELQTLDVGRWKATKFAGERVPTLRDVLSLVPVGRQIFVEIKSGPEIVPELHRQLESCSLQDDQITIISFNRDVIRQCRERMPQFSANWLTGYKQDKQTKVWSPTLDEILSDLKQTNATGLGTQGNRSVIDAEFLKAVRDAGFGFHVWTINEPEDARYFEGLGVDSITTDRPAVIRASLEQRPKVKPASGPKTPLSSGGGSLVP
ncbi:MAG: glycerophosphodiester phosphodiesterase [Fuerstiella sp.]